MASEGESNGKLPLRTCPGCSVSEPYQSPDWALIPAKLAQGLNTHYYYYIIIMASDYRFVTSLRFRVKIARIESLKKAEIACSDESGVCRSLCY